MKRILIALFSVAFIGTAIAADQPTYFPRKVQTVNTYDWSGLNISVHGGYGLNGKTEHPFGTIETDSWFAGGTVGYLRQDGNLVYGGEAEFNWSNLGGSQNFGAATVEHKVNNFGAVKAVLGYAAGPYLLYGHGGLAWANTEATISTPGFSVSADSQHIGWTAGAGLKMMVAGGWALKAEYGYWDLGSATYGFQVAPPIGISVPADVNFHTIKLGVEKRW